MAKIDSRIARVGQLTEDVQDIKDKIKDVASNKGIAINYGIDTMVDVLDNIDNGTIETPTGTKNITDTTLTDVTNYANAQVVDSNLTSANIITGKTILGVSGSAVVPSGTKNITQNGVTDVTNYASADVNVVPSLQNKSVTITENGTQTISADVGYDGLNEVEVTTNVSGGSVSTQSQSIFTGYTAPLTWLNSTNNVFTYESATHNITITGLSGIATITGNGTKSVTVTIDTSSSTDRQTAFTITCVNGEQELTYNGIEFHYGSDVASGKCLAVAQTLINDQIGYIFIESNSLPLFINNTASWNEVYCHQIISFDFAKWSGTSIVTHFLYQCYSFNQPLTIPSGVTSTGTQFLYGCSSFNQPLTIPSSVTSIGTQFLYQCSSFNQPLTIPDGVTGIGSYFLYECYAFNQPLTIPSGVISINNSFLFQCSSFNQPLTIPDGVTGIGPQFLYGCSSFNQPLTIPSSVTSIGGNFLYNCCAFNQPLTIPSGVISINNSFLYQCYSFNQQLTIPDGVTGIGPQFLYQGYAFNQPLTIPSSVTSIGGNFLYNCCAFNQPLVIPNSVTSIGRNFLNNCYSLIYLEYNASVYPTDNYSLSQDTNTKTSSSGTGIKVVGTGAEGLKNALPNRTSSPYRKLV